MNFKKVSLFVASVFASTFYHPAMAVFVTVNNDQHTTVDYSWDLSTAGTMQVGNSTNGTLTVTTGGTLTTNLLGVGRNGANGQINVVNGGVINIANGNSYAYPLAIGGSGGSGTVSQGSVATMNISGAGSQVLVTDTGVGATGDYTVGSEGAKGYLNITDGGKLLNNRGEFWVGSRGGATTQGTVVVNGSDSELYAKKRILIGTYNDGQVTVSNGATLHTDDYISVGRTVDTKTADSMLVVTGQNSLARATAETQIGWLGKGTIVVSDGGKLTTSQAIIANSVGSVGELAIGSRAGETPVAAGVIDTPFVKFGAGDSALVFNHTDTHYQFTPAISGNGRVDALFGTTILNGANTYSGLTNVDTGATLQAGAVNAFSNSSDFTVYASGQLNLGGYDQTIASLNNAGTVAFSNNNTRSVNFSTLTIAGDYVGNDGTLVFNTVLGDDTSQTDKLTVNGNVTGTTKVRVNNLGGLGNDTIEGIELIQVRGTSEADSFVQDGRIVAGIYDYTLTKGNVSGTDMQSWYLQSEKGTLPESGGAGTGHGAGAGANLRPEVGGYLGIIEFAQGAFNHSFHDRQQVSENGSRYSWSRVDYTQGKSKIGQGKGKLTNKTDRTLIQLGSDFYQQGAFHFGGMLGYSRGNVKTDAPAVNITGARYTRSHSDGYSAGLYATWIGLDQDQAGAYVDGYVQYNHFNNTLKGNTLASEKFDSNSVNVSAEAGYGFAVGTLAEADWIVQPQVQLLFNHQNGKEHIEQNGSRIKPRNANDFSGRIGVRLQGTGEKGQVFVTANYWAHSDQASISVNEVKVDSARARHVTELKIGGQIQLSNKTAFFGQIQGNVGSDSTHSYGGNVGLKYQW